VVRVGERVLLSATLRGESSAVPSSELTPAAVDGFTIEPALAAQVRLGSTFVLAGGYAFTFMPAVSTGASAFDPGAAVACVDAGGDLRSDACEKRRVGLARPTAAGRASLSTHSFSLSFSARL
jgi:hypothetical protein